MNFPTISKVSPKSAEGPQPRKAPSRRRSSGRLLIRARRIEVQNLSSLSAEFLDLIFLILLSLSMTSWAGSITEYEERGEHTCDSRLGSSTAYVSSSRSLIGFLLALLGARHTWSSAISTYLNFDDSGRKFLLKVPLQGILSEPVAVYDLDNHSRGQ